MNATMESFGYPHTVIREYPHWVVLLRPKQVTLGSLVLVCKEEALRLSEVSPEAYHELAQVTRDIEAALTTKFAFDKINYLALMMVDPDVHFHVIPRYAESREFRGLTFADAGWPGPPELGSPTPTDAACNADLVSELESAW